jgi:hypothetical protein
VASLPHNIGELARALHERDSASLEIDLPTNATIDPEGQPGVKIDGTNLRFASLADLNRIVAEEVQHELGADGMVDAERLFGAAMVLQRHEIGRPDQASGRLLAAAQASGTDVLQLAAHALGDRIRVFDVLHAIESMLPYCDMLPLHSLIALNDAQHELTHGDMAAGVFFGKLEQWLVPHAATAQALLAELVAKPQDSRGTLTGAVWMGWFASAPERAVQSLLQAVDRRERPLPAVTTWIAGRMLQHASLPQELAHELDTVVLRRLASNEPDERNAALEAATGLLHLRRSFDDELKRLAGTGDQNTLGYIAIAIARESDALRTANLFFEWLAPCKHLGEAYKGALGQLDFALSRLLQATPAERDATLAFLLDWIEAQAFKGPIDRRFAELFNMSAANVLNSPPLLSRVVTQWLLADSKAPAAAVAGLLSGVRNYEQVKVSFDVQLLDGVPDSDLLYLVRRLLGYIIDPEHLLSLALSLLSVPQPQRRVFPMMPSLLGDEIGYDYPGTTIRRLQVAEQAVDSGASALLADIRERIEADMAQLDALPRLKELAPPPALRRAFLRERAKQMAGAMADAQSKSILQQLVTKVHLKGGDRSFHYMSEVQTYTEPMQLSTMSISFEMPRRETLDPVGNAFRMHLNRSAKRGGP